MGSDDREGRPPKRRRLTTSIKQPNNTATSTTTQTQSQFCPADSYEGALDTLKYHGGANFPIEPYYSPDVDPASSNGQNQEPGGEASDCCYGMLCNIPVNLRCGPTSTSKNIPVTFHRPNRLSLDVEDALVFEISCSNSAKILEELGKIEELSLQLYCHSKVESHPRESHRQNSKRRVKPSQQWHLNIIIFGTPILEETVGDYLTRRQMYLQDPIGCQRSVPYKNPHIFPPDDGEIVMTDSFNLAPGELEIERIETGPGLLAQLLVDDLPLAETEAPDIVRTSLFRHQKQALTFMLRREKGWNLDDRSDGFRDIWTRQRDSLGRFSYKNNVSGCNTDHPPPAFHGGLLADDMGLGKTLSMIALIAANQAHSTASRPFSAIKTTLLVVPPALIQAWEKQLALHLRPGSFTTHVYHGQKRVSIESLKQYDIVITTYHTISAIWRKNKGVVSDHKTIFSLTWHRVILDEAHTIQNSKSHLAQACCALRSTRRWAITGTPIQNKLADFASIVKFLQVHPYSDQQTFEEEIFRPWQNRSGTDAQGFLRLKTLVRAITISRTKDVVELPTRVDEIHHLNFTKTEHETYEAAKTTSKILLEEAISSCNGVGKSFHALQLLNRLRLICNHGVLTQCASDNALSPNPQSLLGDWSPDIGDSFFGNLLGLGVSCPTCGGSLSENVHETSFSTSISSQSQMLTSPSDFCQQCLYQVSKDGIAQLPWSDRMAMDSADSSTPTTPGTDGDLSSYTIESMSTKIKALVADLCKHNATQKSVVFSYWTKTLDLVQLMLNDCGVPYTRIDGKTSLRKRNEAQRAFQKDHSIRVILVSITCGGAGLDLTAGSRAYLLEPHWNPMVEEQALCRVHRVGQKQNVTTIRYLMRDSLEEQIVDIQKRKKMLSQVTFAQGPLSETDISVGTLEYLKSVLG